MIKCSNISKLVDNYKKNKLAHAFLIETANKILALEDITELIKILNCPEEYLEKCTSCNLCHLIENNILPNLHFVYPDGQAIKKEQIETLKCELASVPFISKYNIYVIYDAEKLNASSANAMLKFIEEPENNILGFFITNNRENVINTVKSRCEIVRAFYDEKTENSLFFYQNTYSELYNLAVEYIYEIEFEKKKSILYNKTIVDKKLERNDIFILFKIIFEMYTSLLNGEKIDEKLDFLCDYKKSDIFKRIKLVIAILDKLNYNVNLNLILDHFVIELGA